MNNGDRENVFESDSLIGNDGSIENGSGIA
jgi:hypothetical protein